MYSSSNVTVNGQVYYNHSSNATFKFHYNSTTSNWYAGTRPKNNQEARKYLDNERGW